MKRPTVQEPVFMKCSKSRGDKENQTQQKMDKYRLYSQNKWKPEVNGVSVKKNEDAVIELVFCHPNLLFIKPNEVISSHEKSKMGEYTLMQSILDRKRAQLTKFSPKQIDTLKKPSTAPCSSKNREILLQTQSAIKSTTASNRMYKRCRAVNSKVENSQTLNEETKTDSKRVQKSSDRCVNLTFLQEKYSSQKKKRQQMFSVKKDKILTQYIMAQRLYSSFKNR